MFIKGFLQNLHNMKKQMKPDEYYKLLLKIIMICNVEYNDRPEEIEYTEEDIAENE